MNGPLTFKDSDAAISYLQSQYGTSIWNQYEYIRQPFWSYQQYLSAGATTLNFFSQTVGGTVTQVDTNMPSAGNFQSGWNYLVLGLALKFRTLSYDLTAFVGTDATALESDLLAGFAQAGVLTWNVNQFQYLQLPKPFQYCASADGPPELHNRGATSATVSAGPRATLNTRRAGWLAPRPVLIESGQTFQFTLSFPGGLVPVIATSIVNDSTNPLKVGVEMDGILFRPISS